MPYEKIGNNEPGCIADEVPFEIPDSWEWVRLKDIVSKEIKRGKSPKYAVTSDVLVFAQKCNIKLGGIDMSLSKCLDSSAFSKYPSEEYLQDGDIIINSTGNGTLGRIGVFYDTDRIDTRVIVPDSHVTVVRTDNDICRHYLYYALKYYQPYLEKLGAGSTNQTELKPITIANLFIPMPPYKEQNRIANKLIEVFPLVEAYSDKRKNLIKYNFAFPSQLKKSILQQAVMGKLVPQDSNDEPASVLLERIRAEKQQLIKDGNIKKDKHESVIFKRDNSHYEKLGGIERCIDDEIPFEIPGNWEWCRIGSAFTLQAGKNIQAAEISESPFDGAVLCYGGNGIRGYVSITNHCGDYPIIGRQGALCGNINRATGSFYATEHAVCVETFGNTNVSWSCLFLKALNLNQYATATAQPGLAVANINNVLIPLPPLAEQQRIVAKYEELLSQVERL